MSQFDFGTINPDTKSGSALASDLNSWRDALHSMHRGNTRPTYAVSGMMWIDDTATPWLVKMYSGTADTTVATYNATTGVFTPELVDQQVTNAKLAFDGGAFGFRNKIINGNFSINQRVYVSGAATTAGQYTLDRWKVTGTGGITFATTANKTTVTIPSGQTLQQVVEGLNLASGTYVLSWEGTAQGSIAGGTYGASGAVTATITGGTNTTIEFNAGTVTNVQLELGTVATPFEHRPYGLELSLCQRYYEKSSMAPVYALKRGGSDANPHVYVMFKQTKRVIPSVVLSWSNNTGQTEVVGTDGFFGVAVADDFEAITGWTASAEL